MAERRLNRLVATPDCQCRVQESPRLCNRPPAA